MTRRESTPNCLVRRGQKQAQVGNGQWPLNCCNQLSARLLIPTLRSFSPDKNAPPPQIHDHWASEQRAHMGSRVQVAATGGQKKARYPPTPYRRDGLDPQRYMRPPSRKGAMRGAQSEPMTLSTPPPPHLLPHGPFQGIGAQPSILSLNSSKIGKSEFQRLTHAHFVISPAPPPRASAFPLHLTQCT